MECFVSGWEKREKKITEIIITGSLSQLIEEKGYFLFIYFYLMDAFFLDNSHWEHLNTYKQIMDETAQVPRHKKI